MIPIASFPAYLCMPVVSLVAVSDSLEGFSTNDARGLLLRFLDSLGPTFDHSDAPVHDKALRFVGFHSLTKGSSISSTRQAAYARASRMSSSCR
jgi:hypothetical protein